MKDSAVNECVRLIEEARSIAALTGAGISTSAGIPDFRGPQGLYITRQYDPDIIFDISYFQRDPKPFFDFARDFLELATEITPTVAHSFLVRLEREGKLKGIVTQNIDSLHQKAGSQNVFEMHGSFILSHCCKCRKKYELAEMKKRIASETVPHCNCQGVIKPDVVFFGEDVKFLNESYALAGKSDLFFIIGTSCVVYPAASVPQFVKGKIVVINKGHIELPYPNVVLSVEEDIDSFFAQVKEALSAKGK